MEKLFIEFMEAIFSHLNRIATALERLADRSGADPAPQPEPEPEPEPQPEPEPEPQPEPEPEPETEPEPTPEPEPVEQPLIAIADIEQMSNGWRDGNLVLPYWSPWLPSLVEMNDAPGEDRSATLRTAFIGGTFRSGLIQIFQPTFAFGKARARFAVHNPNGVAAFFTFSEKLANGNTDGTECDFELVKRPDGSLAWALGLHQFVNGGRRNPVTSIHVPVTRAQLAVVRDYEIDYQDGYVAFKIDDEEVGRYLHSDLPAGTPWQRAARFDTFVGTYRHTGWSGFVDTDYAAPTTRMEVKGLRVPGL